MEMKLKLILVIFLTLGSQYLALAKDSIESNDGKLKIQEGIASYYGKRFHLKKTANGEIFNMEEMTAAHKNLPFGTKLKVTNLKNGRSVWVRINDRLPQTSKRIIDLSRGAAMELEMIRDGIVPIKLEVDDEETILSLLEHYRDKKPDDMRLRMYETPIEIEKPSIFSMWLEINVKVDLIAMN
jgi:rare lipoprotein A